MPDDAPGLVFPTFYEQDGSVQSDITVVSDLPAPQSIQTFDQTGVGYVGFGQTISYRRVHGLTGMPVAGPASQDLMEIVRLHGGFCVKVITGVTMRIDQLPAVPDPTSQSANEVLYSDEFTLFTPQKMADGENLYGLIYQYSYLLQAMPGPADMLDMGKCPYAMDSATSNRLDPTQFVQYLTGPPASVSWSGGSKLSAGIQKINY